MSAPTAVGAPEYTLGGASDESTEFLGVIVTDAWEMGKFDKWQWHLAIKPTDIQLKSDDAALHKWYTENPKARSAMGAAREAMRKIFGDETPLGKGQLIGKAAWWTRKDISFGKNRETGEEMQANVLIPKRAADEADTKRALAAGGQSGPAAVVVEAAAEELEPEVLEKVLALVVGKDKAELQFATARQPGLTREVKQGLLSGTIVADLIRGGQIKVEDGRYVRVED